MNRREFLKIAGIGAVAATIATPAIIAKSPKPPTGMSQIADQPPHHLAFAPSNLCSGDLICRENDKAHIYSAIGEYKGECDARTLRIAKTIFRRK